MGDELAAAQAALSSFNKTVSDLEEALQPLLKAAAAARDDESVPALSRARANATLAYALNALYYVYLRANSADPSEHPINEHLERVQKLFVRLRTVERQAGERTNTDLHGLRIATERLDEFLLPEEEAILQASKGSTEKYQQHKTFDADANSDSDVDAKKRKKSTKKKSTKAEEQTADYDGDVEMTPVQTKSAKKKRRSTKDEGELKVESEVVEPESMDVGETPKKLVKKKKSEATTEEEEENDTDSSAKKAKKVKKKKRDAEVEEETPKAKKRKSKKKKAEPES